MNFVRQIERLQILNELILQQRTGTPEELAGRLQISRRQVYNHIDTLKNLGAPVYYCKRQKSFYYKEGTEVTISFTFSILSEQQCEKIHGGIRNKSQCARKVHGGLLPFQHHITGICEEMSTA